MPTSVKPFTIKCTVCKKEAISYYRHAYWAYADDANPPIYGYCKKHQKDVFKRMSPDIKQVFTNSERACSYPEIRNEIILSPDNDVAIGSLATQMLATKAWTNKSDTDRILKMASVEAGTIFLVYNKNWEFQATFKKYIKAVDYYDPREQVVIYCGSNHLAKKESKNNS